MACSPTVWHSERLIAYRADRASISTPAMTMSDGYRATLKDDGRPLPQSATEGRMEILLCLRPGTLDKRRQHAARLFEVSADTFRRRERHEPMLVLDLALMLYRRRQAA